MNKKVPYIVFMLLGLAFAIFPTQNAMIDSWYFATCVKYKMELLNTHHLLYNVFGYYWFSLLKLFNPGIEAITALNIMNAIAACICLFVFYKILLLLKMDMKNAFWLSLLGGVSFSFMRFATDAEAYILPLLFSLISTRYFIVYKHNSTLFLSGLFATLAILTHQIQIWWTLAMFIYLIRKKPFQLKEIIAFTLPLLLIPLVYYLTYLQLDKKPDSIIQFIGGEYSKGNAGLDLSMKALGLTLINFVRSFIQLHGLIFDLIENYFAVTTIILGSFSLLVFYAFYKKLFAFKFTKRISENSFRSLFLWAFIFHTLFAFLSSGNAEFMVMLPFLAILYYCLSYESNNIQGIKIIVLLVFFWNLAFGILPNALLNHSRVDHQVQLSIKDPNVICIWKNKPLVENIMAYRYGPHHYKQLINYRELKSLYIDSMVLAGRSVYTDYPNNTTMFSRDALYSEDPKDSWLRSYLMVPIDSFSNLYGKNYLYIVQKRVD